MTRVMEQCRLFFFKKQLEYEWIVDCLRDEVRHNERPPVSLSGLLPSEKGVLHEAKKH